MNNAEQVAVFDRAPPKSLITKFADRYSVDSGKMLSTLKATAFKQRDGTVPTNEQMMALLVVADQYKLNPFTREVYAFPDKQNGIVPVVGVDGWSRIINSHPEFDGMEFNYSEEKTTPQGATNPCHDWVECVMYRKDRSRPIVVREYLDEVYRLPFKEGRKGPWQTHTKRFLRHKAMIQASRIAFGFVGIFDQDEAERITEAEKDITPTSEPIIDFYPQDKFDTNMPAWGKLISAGKKTADEIIATVETKGVLTEKMKEELKDYEIIDVESFEGQEEGQ